MKFRLIITAVAVVLIGIYQYESAKDDLQWGEDKVWTIIKRVALFLGISAITALFILSVGGDSTPDWVPERRWEAGRG